MKALSVKKPAPAPGSLQRPWAEFLLSRISIEASPDTLRSAPEPLQHLLALATRASRKAEIADLSLLPAARLARFLGPGGFLIMPRGALDVAQAFTGASFVIARGALMHNDEGRLVCLESDRREAGLLVLTLAAFSSALRTPCRALAIGP